MKTMSENERRYGKVITVRLSPENKWIDDELNKEIAKAKKLGNERLQSKSRIVEMVLEHWLKNRAKWKEAEKANKTKR